LQAEQHGLITSRQLGRFGVTPDAIEANVDAGRWQHVLPRVYATYAGPLPRSALMTAALLYAGPAALLSHRTAAEEWGMLDKDDGPIHVTVPYGCSAVSQPPWLVVHRSRAFDHITVHTEPARVGRVVSPAIAECYVRIRVIPLAVEPHRQRDAHVVVGGVLPHGPAVDPEGDLAARRR